MSIYFDCLIYPLSDRNRSFRSLHTSAAPSFAMCVPVEKKEGGRGGGKGGGERDAFAACKSFPMYVYHVLKASQFSETWARGDTSL